MTGTLAGWLLGRTCLAHDTGLAIAIILIQTKHGSSTGSRSVFVAVSASEMRQNVVAFRDPPSDIRTPRHWLPNGETETAAVAHLPSPPESN